MGMSNWYLAVCGINHRTSLLEEREPVQLGRDDMAKAHAEFSNHPDILESTIVATCNRVEFYFVARKEYGAFDAVKNFYRNFRNIDISNLSDSFYTKRNRHAADHLFRVAAGIDSMVIGENQVLAQIKEAYSSACAIKTAGKVIHRLFHQAFRVGKSVRTDTEMGKGACSVSSAAVEMLNEQTKAADKPAILFVGINQMITLAANGLRRLEYNNFTFANRTPERAVAFAAGYNASGHSLERLKELISKSDIVITCTGSMEPFITKNMIDNYLSENPSKKLILMDMAVPRDSEIDKNYHELIKVFDLDDIKAFVRDQQIKREQAIPQAEQIIERKLGEFVYWFDHVRYEPIYNGLYDAFENIRLEEMEAILEKLPSDQKAIVNQATKNLVSKLVHLKVRLSSDNKKTE
ncbi:MAG: glutamyl-tRNA reductase [Candidatus Zixiibacteriota bacterium]